MREKVWTDIKSKISTSYLVGLLSLIFVINLIGFFYVNGLHKEHEIKNSERNIETGISLLRPQLKYELWNYNEEKLKQIINDATGSEYINHIVIFYDNKSIIASDGYDISQFGTHRDDLKSINYISYDLKYNFNGKDEILGQIIVYPNLDLVDHHVLENNIIYFLIFIITIACMIWYTLSFFKRKIETPLSNLKIQVNQLDNTTDKDLKIDLNLKESNEFKYIEDGLNSFIEKSKGAHISGDFIEQFLEVMSDIVVITDTNGKIQLINDEIFNTASFRPKQLIGKPIESLFEENSTLIHHSNNFNLVKGIELSLKKSDGGHIPVMLASSGAPMNNPTSYIFCIKDVSQVKLMEKDLKEVSIKYKKEHEQETSKYKSISEMQSLLITNISNQFRSPLNGIFGYTDLIGRETNPNDEQKKYLKNIVDCAQILKYSLDDIVDLSQLEYRELQLKKDYFVLEDLLEHLHNLHDPQASIKNLELKFACNIETSVTLFSDKKRIGQILSNLLSNAIKFTKQGNVKLDILIKSPKLESSKIIFTVKDSGVGLKPDEISTILQGKLLSGESQQNFGRGVGLTLIKKLTQLFKGELSITSEEGKGTTFKIIMDISIDHSNEINNGNSQKLRGLDKTFAQRYPTSILIVEDEMLNQQLIKRFLANLGYDAELASNGQEALTKAVNNKYQLILMDIQMPVMNGLEATKFIKRLDYYSGEESRIYALTANVMQDDIDKYNEVGMSGCISKPVKLEELAEVILETHNSIKNKAS